MDWLYQHAAKPLLFRLDPERAHELAVGVMAGLGRVRPLCALLERWHRLAPDLMPRFGSPAWLHSSGC
jgi:dihydroorotate dehydrogenase